MKPILMALALGLLAVASLVRGLGNSLGAGNSGPPIIASPRTPELWLTVAGVLGVAALLVLLGRFDRGRTGALIRLDWFLPMLRRLKSDQYASHSLPGRWLRKVMPEAVQSDWRSKRRGGLRRLLRRLGPSWLASPARRLVQATCWITFVLLFCYVCWPYDAKPASPPHQASGWRFSGIDQRTGEVNLSTDDALRWAPRVDQTVLLTSDSDPSGGDGQAIAFRVADMQAGSMRLEATDGFNAKMLDTLVGSTGTWTVWDSDPNQWPTHYAGNLAAKERLPAELFLIIDPLVSFSTAVASRSLVWSLVSAAMILIVCVLIPRGFCGYLCPLGTTIDLFDWAVSGRVKRFRVSDEGWWVHVKYYLLAGILICAIFGVLVSGFFAAIPVITRAMLFLVDPVQSGVLRGWHLVPTPGWEQLLSIVLFLGVLSLGFLRPRFWCKYVCPSGAVFSLGNLFRATERKVESSCIHCNKCVEICPFDAIKPDFTTRTTDCTLCQSCGGVCPTHAIKFVERWNVVELKVDNDPPTGETALGRRGFLSLAGGTAAAIAGGTGIAAATKAFGANLDDDGAFLPVRPPGSVPEQDFLQLCIRCGECFKACPNNVLQPEGFQQGLEGLWSPMVVADWAGCESSCNACGQVCPTGAIRALPIEEKRVARMGLAVVNQTTCLPFADSEACDLCVQECNAAGYHAIEYTQVHTEVDANGVPIEGTGYRAPVVMADRCVGCGLCQTRCHAINVKERGVLKESAIIIEAGEGKEDRLVSGSYRELRQQEAAERDAQQVSSDYFVPDAPAPPVSPDDDDANPFGLPVSSEPKADQPDDDPFGLGN